MHISERINAEERLLGTFVKTPHHVILEVLAGTGLDFAILDAEHSPYGIAEIDRCVMASKGADLPCLVRVADPSPAAILRILDMGADGFLAPHVLNADQAERIVQSARYGAGGRGYAATNRAGSYGLTPMKEHLKISEHAAVILQIEDPEGVENIDEIVEVDGITACFIGRADIAVAYGAESMDAPTVSSAVEKVRAACKRRKLPVATFVANLGDTSQWYERDFQILAVGSEHTAIQRYFSQDVVVAAKL